MADYYRNPDGTIDRDKVIQELELDFERMPDEETHVIGMFDREAVAYALQLLKAQEPHILNPDELGGCGIGWIEHWFGKEHPKVQFERCAWAGWRVLTQNLIFSLEPYFREHKYGKLCGFRVWVGGYAPSEKMREAVEWDD